MKTEPTVTTKKKDYQNENKLKQKEKNKVSHKKEDMMKVAILQRDRFIQYFMME